ncbi:hypothetical protein E8E11_010421 [Didymella keratinophila]|nr:hypothetical protein E8E11_010421 [Didymella keratinophila]
MSVRTPNSSVPFIDPANQSGNPLEVPFPNFASPSPQTSFLSEAFEASGRKKTNLKIYTQTLGQKVLFDHDKIAYGVLNMWDHVVLSVGQQASVETYRRLMNRTAAAEAELDYTMNQAGILTNDQSDYLGWEKLPAASRLNFSNSASNDLSAFPADWPEAEYEIPSAPFGTPPFSTPENPIDVGYLQPVLLTSLSRGNVAVATIKRGRQFFNTSAIAPIIIGEELLPGQGLPVGSTEEEILSYLQKSIGFNWHASW